MLGWQRTFGAVRLDAKHTRFHGNDNSNQADHLIRATTVSFYSDF